MKKKVGCMKIKDSKCPQLYCCNCMLSLDSYFVICNEETLGAGIERLCKPIINKFGDELYSKLISTQAINLSKESWLEKK